MLGSVIPSLLKLKKLNVGENNIHDEGIYYLLKDISTLKDFQGLSLSRIK